jgi:hypothetical protein
MRVREREEEGRRTVGGMENEDERSASERSNKQQRFIALH